MQVRTSNYSLKPCINVLTARRSEYFPLSEEVESEKQMSISSGYPQGDKVCNIEPQVVAEKINDNTLMLADPLAKLCFVTRNGR